MAAEDSSTSPQPAPEWECKCLFYSLDVRGWERDGGLERGLLTCEKEATAVPELDEENLQAQTAKRKEVKTETSATLCRRNTGTR